MTLDTRTAAEKRYDSLKDGSAYAKTPASCSACGAELAPAARFCDACGQPAQPFTAAVLEYIVNDSPHELQIVRHTHHTDGSKASDPWTTYKLGEAEIDIQDAGGVNLYIGRESIEIDENAQLLDLAQLLADERVLEALDPSKEDTSGIISILEECDGGERCAIDVNFDRVVDAVAELPDSQRAAAITLWEGFLAGVAIAESIK